MGDVGGRVTSSQIVTTSASVRTIFILRKLITKCDDRFAHNHKLKPHRVRPLKHFTILDVLAAL